MINAYYTDLSNLASASVLSSHFVDSDLTMPQGSGAVIVPGDSAALSFAGLYMGANQIQTYHIQMTLALQYNTPLQVRRCCFAVVSFLFVSYMPLVVSIAGSAGQQRHEQRQRGHVLALERRRPQLAAALLYHRMRLLPDRSCRRHAQDCASHALLRHMERHPRYQQRGTVPAARGADGAEHPAHVPAGQGRAGAGVYRAAGCLSAVLLRGAITAARSTGRRVALSRCGTRRPVTAGLRIS